MLWIYLSPHFDDVAFSCGGLVWEQVHAGDSVRIWTVCAADPPNGELSPFAQELHSRWEASQSATPRRKTEDQSSCRRLGASNRYFGILDCIYRRHPETGQFIYTTEASLNGPLHPGDHPIISLLQDDLDQSLQSNVNLVSPLAIGNHVDHQLTRQSLEGLRRPLWYYADYPYVERHRGQVEDIERAGWTRHVFPISRKGLAAWQDSIAAHRSQISTFWPGDREMRQAIEIYWGWHSGICLWTRPDG